MSNAESANPEVRELSPFRRVNVFYKSVTQIRVKFRVTIEVDSCNQTSLVPNLYKPEYEARLVLINLGLQTTLIGCKPFPRHMETIESEEVIIKPSPFDKDIVAVELLFPDVYRDFKDRYKAPDANDAKFELIVTPDYL